MHYKEANHIIATYLIFSLGFWCRVQISYSRTLPVLSLTTIGILIRDTYDQLCEIYIPFTFPFSQHLRTEIICTRDCRLSKLILQRAQIHQKLLIDLWYGFSMNPVGMRLILILNLLSWSTSIILKFNVIFYLNICQSNSSKNLNVTGSELFIWIVTENIWLLHVWICIFLLLTRNCFCVIVHKLNEGKCSQRMIP